MFQIFNGIADQQDWRLVVLAGLICVLAGVNASKLFHRARLATGHARIAWMVTAAAAAACGIWVIGSFPSSSLVLNIAFASSVLLAMAMVTAVVDRRAEKKARKQSLLFETALHNMSHALLMFDAEDRLILFNQRYADLYRLDTASIQLGTGFAEQFRLRKAAGTFGPDPEKYTAQVVDQSGRFRGNPGKGRFQTEGHETKLIELPDGRCISITNQRMPGGGWVATHSDITEQRNAENERDRTRTFLDTIVDHVPATLVVKNVHDRRYVLINRAGENFFGLPREQMIGKTSHEVFGKAQADIIAARDDELLASSSEIVRQRPSTENAAQRHAPDHHQEGDDPRQRRHAAIFRQRHRGRDR